MEENRSEETKPLTVKLYHPNTTNCEYVGQSWCFQFSGLSSNSSQGAKRAAVAQINTDYLKKDLCKKCGCSMVYAEI